MREDQLSKMQVLVSFSLAYCIQVSPVHSKQLGTNVMFKAVRLRWFQHEDSHKVHPDSTSETVLSKSTASKNIDRRFEIMLDFLKKERNCYH